MTLDPEFFTVDPLVESCPNCVKCGGRGYIMKDGDPFTQIECNNLFLRRVGLKLGVEIATAATLADSPLYVWGGKDKTQSNLFLKGDWVDLLPHLKCALLRKFYSCGVEAFSFRVVTDERLKNVYLSNEAYTAKQRKKRDEGEVYNSLSDLIGNSHNLIIIRLGFLGYKNVAMPGILKETLMMRQAQGVPTWVVEDPDSLFVPGHFSWSLDVSDYLTRYYETLDFTSAVRTPRSGLPEEEDEGLGLDTPETKVAPEPKPRVKAQAPVVVEGVADFSSDLALGTGYVKKNYKKGGRG